VFNASASGVLINAGVAKIVAPGALLRASAEVLAMPPRAGEPLVRGLGAIEVAAATALLAAPARLPGAIAVAVLGVCFASVGVVGVLRGSSVPCGCFGGVTRQPLGWANVALGIALAAAWPVNLLTGWRPGADYSLRIALLTSIASVVLCLWLNRSLIARVLRASRIPQPEVS
jgi:hypothetical protein